MEEQRQRQDVETNKDGTTGGTSETPATTVSTTEDNMLMNAISSMSVSLWKYNCTSRYRRWVNRKDLFNLFLTWYDMFLNFSYWLFSQKTWCCYVYVI